MAAVRAHVFITGRVQAVSYRYYCRQEAGALGIKGWIRNLSDGKVEAVFEGERKAVEEMIEWCKAGSSSAEVSKVAVKWESAENLQGFEIRSTK